MNPRPSSFSYPSSTRHARLFWLAVLAALAVGLPLRSWLRHPHVEALLREQIARALPPGDELTAERVSIQLADGVWPQLAVQLETLSYRKGGCRDSFTAEAKEVLLPVSTWQLLQGRLTLNTLRVSQGRLQLNPSSCEASQSEAQSNLPTVPVVSASGNQPDEAERAIRRLRNNLEHLHEKGILKGLKVDHLIVFAPGQSEAWTLRRLSFSGLASEVLQFEGILQFPRWPGYSQHLPQINFWGENSPTRLALEMRGHWREGTFSFLANVEGALDQEKIHVETSIQHLPLFQVSEVVDHIAKAKREMRPRLAWLSCEGQLQAKLSQLLQTPFVVSPCQIEGALGQITIPQLTLRYNGGLQMEGLKARLEQVSLDALLELAQLAAPVRGVVANLGVLNGEIEVLPNGALFQGELSGVDILFSNVGRRAIQRVDRLKAHLKWGDGRLLARLSDISLRDGEASGSAQLNLTDDLSEGTFRFQFDPIRLAPHVESLLTSGRLSGAKMTGEGSLAQHKLVSWRSEMHVEELKRNDLSLKGIRIQAGTSAAQALGHLEVRSLELDSHSPQLQWLRPLLLTADVSGPLRFAQLRAELDVFGRVFSWRGLQMALAGNARVLVSTSGGWNDSDELRGWVQLSRNGVNKRWLLQGERERPSLAAADLTLQEMRHWQYPHNGSLLRRESEPAQPLGAQLLSQIRSWLPKFGREPSAKAGGQ